MFLIAMRFDHTGERLFFLTDDIPYSHNWHTCMIHVPNQKYFDIKSIVEHNIKFSSETG